MNFADIEKAKQMLDPLFAKLGAAGAHVYELAIRQQIVGGVTNLVWAVAVIVAAIAFFKLGKYLWKSAPKAYDEVSCFMGSIFSYGASFGLVLLALTNITDAIKVLLNPEWYAIQSIVNMLVQQVK